MKCWKTVGVSATTGADHSGRQEFRGGGIGRILRRARQVRATGQGHAGLGPLQGPGRILRERQRVKSNFLALALVVLSLAGCADTTRRLQKEEVALNTDGPITRQFHSALYYPFEIVPRFDGYLVGIEKVRRPKDGIDVQNWDRYGLKKEALQAKFNDGKVMAVTHVIRHHADARQPGNCALFNAYVQSPESAARQLVPACGNPSQATIREPAEAFSNSWEALDGLARDLQLRIETRQKAVAGQSSGSTAPDFASGPAYTHIVVVVMGWNTVQEEAVRNINSLVWNMGRASTEQTPSPEPFNPLVIGVTWPSQWSSDWIDPAVKILSFPTKAGDADEVGMSWLGVLLHDTLPNVRKQLHEKLPDMKPQPVVVLGHSFGAKASSVAVCAGPAVVHPKKASVLPLTEIDVLVNLQPAYLSERIFGRSSVLQNVIYANGCTQAKRFVITASAGDTAVPLPFWGTYLGEQKSYEKFCAPDYHGPRLAHCAVARADGQAEPKRPGTAPNLYYIDASELIAESAYGTGGGSHSDIYRLEHGRLIYSAVMGRGLWAPSGR
ncbi:hypothetical protein M4R22_20740 [Acidovorax sp. GBBC 3334]|uniref:hypothetical protein n=1 Tax=Acidovorax sp. GBBC 3334 TaxID=2940496 RepID=UPI0023042A3B|nr:hypothetical protein [Acidovorax sp. GBBC 3334]MDA8457192.1 hypothetical protein [Acidovorax sp. GBBC 3334]